MTSRTVSFALPAAPVSLRQVWITACAVYRTRQTRRLLAVMDDRMLADIGASRADAQMEAGRAFYDLMR